MPLAKRVRFPSPATNFWLALNVRFLYVKACRKRRESVLCAATLNQLVILIVVEVNRDSRTVHRASRSTKQLTTDETRPYTFKKFWSAGLRYNDSLTGSKSASVEIAVVYSSLTRWISTIATVTTKLLTSQL